MSFASFQNATDENIKKWESNFDGSFGIDLGRPVTIIILKSKANKHFGGIGKDGLEFYPAMEGKMHTYIDIGNEQQARLVMEDIIADLQQEAFHNVKEDTVKYAKLYFPPDFFNGLAGFVFDKAGANVKIDPNRIDNVEIGCYVKNWKGHFSFYFNHGPLVNFTWACGTG